MEKECRMERVHLRQLHEGDREFYGIAYREEPGNSETGEALIDLMFKTCLSHPEDEMAILLGQNDEWCGYCSVFHREDDTYELGINLRPEYQGRGIGVEAIRQMMVYVQSKHVVKKFTIETTKNNMRCQRMCEKLGAKLENEVSHPLEQMFEKFEKELGTEAFQRTIGGTSLDFPTVLRYVINETQ